MLSRPTRGNALPRFRLAAHGPGAPKSGRCEGHRLALSQGWALLRRWMTRRVHQAVRCCVALRVAQRIHLDRRGMCCAWKVDRTAPQPTADQHHPPRSRRTSCLPVRARNVSASTSTSRRAPRKGRVHEACEGNCRAHREQGAGAHRRVEDLQQGLHSRQEVRLATRWRTVPHRTTGADEGSAVRGGEEAQYRRPFLDEQAAASERSGPLILHCLFSRRPAAVRGRCHRRPRALGMTAAER